MENQLTRDWFLDYPPPLRGAVVDIAKRRDLPLYVAGGAVRDWMRGIVSTDLDLTVPREAVAWARELAYLLGGAFVLLDAQEDVARVVWQGCTIDISAFRQGSRSIEEDLVRRDFSINAMAVEISPLTGTLVGYSIIDPTGGAADLATRQLRMVAKNAFVDDPLRMLRAVRFMATLGFVVDPATRLAIHTHRALILRVAAERINHELDLIFSSTGSHAAVLFLMGTGLLGHILPELTAGQSIVQPDSHHLDVLEHSLEALRWLDVLLTDHGEFFGGQAPVFGEWLGGDSRRAVQLRWAALLHDIGKPVTHGLSKGRITFHNHDQAGADLLRRMAMRLRWPRREGERIARLVALHMWPFHLNNVRMRTSITRRACLRLSKAVGEDMPGLFLLAMADSLAGNGPGKPEGMEKGLAELFAEVHQVWLEHIHPVLILPPLITGHDLRDFFDLPPGPLFREILSGLEMARVDGTVTDRDQALSWVRIFLAAHH